VIKKFEERERRVRAPTSVGSDFAVRALAVEVLGAVGDVNVIEPLVRRLTDDDQQVSATALQALQKLDQSGITARKQWLRSLTS